MKKYFAIPIEIRNKIKERVEEVGNVYDEVHIANWYETNDVVPGTGNNGFFYDDSIEGFMFWANVINAREYELFFEKYPVLNFQNNDFEKDTAYPDEKVGTVYRKKSSGELVSLKNNDGSHCPYFWNENKSDFNCLDWCELERIDQPIASDRFPSKSRPNDVVGTQYVLCEKYDGYPIGAIVTLIDNDKTDCCYFKFPDGKEGHIMWKRLKSIVDKPPKQRAIGNQYKVVSDGILWKINDIVVFKNDDGTSSPLFYNTRTKNDAYIPWEILKLIPETETSKVTVNNLINNLNTTNNGKENHTNKSILSWIPATISFGPTPRGVELSSTRGKILLGG